MSLVDILLGNAVLISGVEPDPEEADRDRVYVGPRYNWHYVLVQSGSVHMNWMGHTFTTLPKDAPIYCDEEARDRARSVPEEEK